MDSLREAAVRQGVVCGIDLGSKHDYTAVIVLEVETHHTRRSRKTRLSARSTRANHS